MNRKEHFGYQPILDNIWNISKCDVNQLNLQSQGYCCTILKVFRDLYCLIKGYEEQYDELRNNELQLNKKDDISAGRITSD